MGADVDDIAALPVVDQAAVEAIDAVDSDLLAELVDCYRRDGRAHVTAIVDAHRGGDLDEMRRRAHALKGASGTIGARRVERLCAQVQRATLEEASRWIAALEDAFEASERAVSAAAPRASRTGTR